MAAQEISENDLQTAVDRAVEKALHTHAPTLRNPEKTPEPVSSTKESHPIYDFMQSCPNCGQANTEYKPTKYKCTSCHVPVVPDRTDKCWNCGNKEAEKVDEENEDD